MFRITIDRRPHSARRIFCVTSGCGQQGELLDKVPGGMAPALIESRFQNKGWQVGRDSSDDYCPSCVATRQAERRAKRFKSVSEIKSPPVQPEETKVETVMTALNGSDAPHEMSRADRRIIFSQLEECYGDETTGYKDGWSDSAVAKHLGSHIPVAWVAAVREENFGPTKDNGEVRDMLSRVEAMRQEAINLLVEAKKVRIEAAAVVEKINDLAHKSTDLTKRLDGVQATADRIKAYVS